MSLYCTSLARECDGCMKCQSPGEPVAECAECGEPIYAGEDYYRFPDDEAVHDDCVLDYINEHYFVRG